MLQYHRVVHNNQANRKNLGSQRQDQHNEHAIALERSGGFDRRLFNFGYLRRRLCGEYHGRSHRHVIAHREEIISARNAAMAIRQQGQEDRGIFVIGRWDVR
jgi:hypothetical protein